MGTLVSIIIASLFLSIIFVNRELGRPIKKLFGIQPSKFVKPLDCIPCMSFWFAILVCVMWHLFVMQLEWLTITISIMGAFVVAYTINRK